MRARLSALVALFAILGPANLAGAESNHAYSGRQTTLKAIARSMSSAGEAVDISVTVEIFESNGVRASTDGTAGPANDFWVTARVSSGTPGAPDCVSDDVVLETDRQSGDIAASSAACGFDLTWHETSPVPTSDGVSPPNPSAGYRAQQIDASTGTSVETAATVTGSIGGVPIDPTAPQIASWRRDCCPGHVTLMR